MPTWIISQTSQAISEFENKILNNSLYPSDDDDEIQLIMHYFREEVNNNDGDNEWYLMEYNNGLWYPGQVLGYTHALSECVRPCYLVDKNGITPVLQRQRSHGGRKKRRRKHKKKTRGRKKRKRRVRRRSRKHRK